MSEPTFSATTERIWSGLPDIVRAMDAEQTRPALVEALSERANYCPPLESWQYSSRSSYDPVTKTARITSSAYDSFNALRTPFIEIPESTYGVFSCEFFSANPKSGSTTDAGSYYAVRYYNKDGAPEFNSSGFVSNGRANTYPRNAWSDRNNLTQSGVDPITGPNIRYLRFEFGLHATWTSLDYYIRNPMLTFLPWAGRSPYVDITTEGYDWIGEPGRSGVIRRARPAIIGGFPLKKYISSVGDQVDEVDIICKRVDFTSPDEGVVADTSDLVDPMTADESWLPWLAQLVGISLQTNLNAEEQRDAIRSAVSGYRSGTKGAIVASAQSALTGTKFAKVYDHSTSAEDGIGKGGQWDVLIVTRASETPSGADVLDTVVRKGVKPAGVRLYHRTFSTPWSTIESVAPTWADWESYTWQELEELAITATTADPDRNTYNENYTATY